MTDMGRLLAELDELREENRRLRNKNGDLQEENRRLRNENDMLKEEKSDIEGKFLQNVIETDTMMTLIKSELEELRKALKSKITS